MTCPRAIEVGIARADHATTWILLIIFGLQRRLSADTRADTHGEAYHESFFALVV
jgi:hypothetical protein